MGLKIKICGLSTLAAVDAAIKGGASHAGFIFFEKSPRHLTPQAAAPLAARARLGGGLPVAVTVNATDGFLDEMVAAVAPAMLQLHGHETPDRVAQVKARYRLPVIKALAISEAADLAKLDAYRGVADSFLLDAKPPAGSDLPGGNGVSFDWSLLSLLDGRTNYMLSGGLNASNVAQALAMAAPPGIDVSSGVESAPGRKDIVLIEQFFLTVAAAQEAEQLNALGGV